jgi:hypothetical protein
MLKLKVITPWLVSISLVIGAIFFVAHKQHHATEEYETERQKRCATGSLDAEQQRYLQTQTR